MKSDTINITHKYRMYSVNRTPNSSNANNVRNVNSDGSLNNNNAYNGNNGVRFDCEFNSKSKHLNANFSILCRNLPSQIINKIITKENIFLFRILYFEIKLICDIINYGKST